MRCGQCSHPIANGLNDMEMAEHGFLQCPFLPSWQYVSTMRIACEKVSKQAAPEAATTKSESLNVAELF